MTEQTKSKMIAPVEIFQVLKAAKENGRLVDNLSQIAREIARLDPAYVAFCARNDAKTLKEMVEEACTFGAAEQPAAPATNTQIRKLEWVQHGDTWKCFSNDEYNVYRWWEGDTPSDKNDPSVPHFFIIGDDDNQVHDTIEKAMEAAQTLFEEVANSYLVTPVPSSDERFNAGREDGLREGAKIASDFVWKRYKNDGIVTSHDYEKVRELILEQIEHPAHEDTEDAAPSPR